jgi:hypothetical protein
VPQGELTFDHPALKIRYPNNRRDAKGSDGGNGLVHGSVCIELFAVPSHNGDVVPYPHTVDVAMLTVDHDEVCAASSEDARNIGARDHLPEAHRRLALLKDLGKPVGTKHIRAGAHGGQETTLVGTEARETVGPKTSFPEWESHREATVAGPVPVHVNHAANAPQL